MILNFGQDDHITGRRVLEECLTIMAANLAFTDLEAARILIIFGVAVKRVFAGFFLDVESFVPLLTWGQRG